MEKLRDEIIEAQKIRADLIKWKLVLVAALGASGLGLGASQEGSMYMLLGLIPFVCSYVDLETRHLELRVHVIAAFMRHYSKYIPQQNASLSDYEVYCKSLHDRKIFTLASNAPILSTSLISCLVIISTFVLPSSPSLFETVILIMSGLIGLSVTQYCEDAYKKQRQKIDAGDGLSKLQKQMPEVIELLSADVTVADAVERLDRLDTIERGVA